MVNRIEKYTDLRGATFALSGLSKQERAQVKKLQEYAASNPEWHDYLNFWMAEMNRFCTQSGLGRREIIDSVVYRIGQDLGSRLGIRQGKVRRSDYRDELEQLILTRFRTRREFCEASGLSEDMLSHVLARRKHLAIDTLADALAKVGYTIHIVPMSEPTV
ncbi:MAG TPA: hypothetical protein VMP01_19370 [Pirellulaceae bacterium]|nr:hypothetical protein [Pirellulaceae bacterium]